MARRFPASALLALKISMAAQVCLAAQPTPQAVSAFQSYISIVESRLVRQHQSSSSFLINAGSNRGHLRQGDVIVEQLTSATPKVSGALLHHWRATAFVPGANAADFERLMKSFNAYPQYFYPQVLQAKVFARSDDHFQVTMRMRQRHGLTVVLDTTSDITFGQLDAQHRFSTSRSTRISEIDSAGRTLLPDEEHGFLWRLNTYWSCEEAGGGLYMQVESVSLTRSIPYGLGWALRPYIESVPRESLEFTLASTRNALSRSTNNSR